MVILTSGKSQMINHNLKSLHSVFTPICLPSPMDIFDGFESVATGWGYTSPTSSPSSVHLRPDVLQVQLYAASASLLKNINNLHTCMIQKRSFPGLSWTKRIVTSSTTKNFNCQMIQDPIYSVMVVDLKQR